MSVVRVEDVTKRFGTLQALDPTSFTVTGEQICVLVGPSGCGKTTLLRLIAGLEKPTSGTLSVGGVPPSEAAAGKLIGYVPQQPTLLPWLSVRANAELLVEVNPSVPATGPSIDELLDECGLTAFADAMPHQLSGGMQQRVALVRAFRLGSPLLLLDEPFAALDDFTRTSMRHLLARLCQRHHAAAIFVTHSLDEAAFLGDVVHLMSPRPGGIVDSFIPPPDRVRGREWEDDPRLFDMVRSMRAALASGVAA